MKNWFKFGLIFFLVLAYLLKWDKAQAICMLIYSLTFIITDFKNGELRRFDISTTYAVLLALTSVSHITALFGLSDNPWFFRSTYSSEISAKAIFIFNIGSALSIEFMRKVLKKEKMQAAAVSLEGISVQTVVIGSLIVFFLSNYLSSWIFAIGSIGTFFTSLINGSVLLASFLANRKRKNQLIALSYAFFLAIWHLKYSYLRMEIVIPFVAYLAGDLLAQGSVLRLHSLSKILLVGCLIIFPPLFTYLGEVRGKARGDERLSLVLNEVGKERKEGGETIITRLSIIPQLSQIIMLTEKKGFYDGSTLGYLGFVFIPRFLWPEKPLIKQGQWFALEIGAAYEYRSGKVNNSVNMTVPGEFYLNFGFIGVVLGCILFGLFTGWLWNQTNYDTLFGWAFRFYLIFLGLFSLGADLQILPSLIALLLIYKASVYFNNAWRGASTQTVRYK